MAADGPIMIIEDDLDDIEVLQMVFDLMKVPNEIKFFTNCNDAHEYLKVTKDKPFLIFSDINLPGMSGLEFKKIINRDAYLRRKSIPFIYLTTTSTHSVVLESYESLSQGFFTKPNKLDDLAEMMTMILNYWAVAKHPNPNLIS